MAKKIMYRIFGIKILIIITICNVFAGNIITEKDGVPVFENRLGCKLVPYHDETGWGLGTFYLNGVKLGGTITHFVQEESVGKEYRVPQYQILINNSEQGSIRFFGKDDKLDFSVVVSLGNDGFAYTLEYDFDAMHPVFHPLFVNIPFFSSKTTFVKYPNEHTINPSLARRIVVKPDRSRAPFFFGNETINGKDYFIGVGYFLTDNFKDGRFEFDPAVNPDSPFRIYTPFEGMARPINLQCVTKLELVRADLENDYKKSRHKFNIIITTAGGQFDCVRSYIRKSGYDTSVRFEHSIDESLSALMGMYKNTPGYVKGKGYHQLIRFDSGDFDTTIPHGWYSKYIVTGPQILVAYELYKYWKSNPGETWARERSIEMADFMLEMQQESGAFTHWDTDVGRVTTMHPNDVEGTEFNTCIYSMSDMGFGIYHLYLLYDEMKTFEGIDRTDWKKCIEKGINYMADLVKPNGELGRNYSPSGAYDKQTSGIIEALQAFDMVYEHTADKKLEQARDRLENWLYSKFIKSNSWINGSNDGGAWQGASWPPPENNDIMGVITYAAYCSHRYAVSGDEKYVKMAKDVVSYMWLTVTPVDLEGFSHGTRTLVREQDFYSAYGVVIRGNESVECLPYLSKVTGDPFFMQFYRIIIQNNINYQAFDKPYPAFYLGLECDETGKEPIDKIAESSNGYIVRFASEFVRSVTSPLAYRYVGGEGWGLGADYNLAFSPDFGTKAPYVLSASTMVRDISWDQEKKTMHVFLYDKSGKEGLLEIKWKPDLYPVSAVSIEIDGKQVKAADFWDEQKQVIAIPYKHKYPSEFINIQYNK